MKGKIHLLRVEPLLDQYLEMRVKEAEEWLDQFIAENFKDTAVHRGPVVTGDPSVKILEYIDQHEIDCVIIGTHGRRGLKGVLFGSVAKDIVSKSPVPVLTLNPYLMTKSFKKRNAIYLEELMANRDVK